MGYITLEEAYEAAKKSLLSKSEHPKLKGLQMSNLKADKESQSNFQERKETSNDKYSKN